MWKLGAVACACLLSTASLAGLEIKTARIAGADTKVTLEAGADAPRLLQLSGEDGFKWTNQKPDTLIDFVEAGAHRLPVRWRLNLAASQISSTRVEYVYDSTSPRLRLFWDWR